MWHTRPNIIPSSDAVYTKYKNNPLINKTYNINWLYTQSFVTLQDKPLTCKTTQHYQTNPALGNTILKHLQTDNFIWSFIISQNVALLRNCWDEVSHANSVKNYAWTVGWNFTWSNKTFIGTHMTWTWMATPMLHHVMHGAMPTIVIRLKNCTNNQTLNLSCTYSNFSNYKTQHNYSHKKWILCITIVWYMLAWFLYSQQYRYHKEYIKNWMNSWTPD